jgi:hypothetical protein
MCTFYLKDEKEHIGELGVVFGCSSGRYPLTLTFTGLYLH